LPLLLYPEVAFLRNDPPDIGKKVDEKSGIDSRWPVAGT